ncbi:MAG: SemiSWEET transporter [Desulfovibrionaceae bacterium]|nr:SemiSWEET transporter [Desulfovibrionaceae bacterium]
MPALWMETFGIVAGTLTTVSFFPQVVKTWRSKEVKDISLAMYLILTSGILLWIVYGLLIDSISVILANIVTFVLTVAILVMKIRYR